MDLRGLHYTAKDHSREIQENSMAKQRRTKYMSLEVHVMFEPTRLEPTCLQQAYAWVVPCARKRLSPPQTGQQLSGETLGQRAERSAQ
jgi:hypothetical protein